MTDTATTYEWLTPDDYLRHLRADTDRILDGGGRRLTAAVPLCLGWNVRDAVEHTGLGVQPQGRSQWWERAPTERVAVVAPPRR
jgi:hypothetical protein